MSRGKNGKALPPPAALHAMAALQALQAREHFDLEAWQQRVVTALRLMFETERQRQINETGVDPGPVPEIEPPQLACYTCGNPMLEILPHRAVLFIGPPDEQPRRAVMTVAVVCPACGEVRQFQSSRLMTKSDIMVAPGGMEFKMRRRDD